MSILKGLWDQKDTQDPQRRVRTNLSIVVACYNEERTLRSCIDSVLQIAMDDLALEIIIVNDGSQDRSLEIAHQIAADHPEVRVIAHERNQGKGAALRTGLKSATGEFVAIQDADLEYDPMELRKLLEPLVSGQADVVLGSRFLSSGAHRVLYFWHYLGNRFLTLCSNMFTDLNLTDMETCYKVFRRDVIQQIELRENRFGFEPEVVAKVAQLRVRIYETGISYRGRTYEEGKKIGVRDGFWALYCIVRYNLHRAPLPMQFAFYLLIGGVAAIVNLIVFDVLYASGSAVFVAAPAAFVIAAAVNYFLGTLLLFRHRARWNSVMEIVMYAVVVILAGGFDLACTSFLITGGTPAGISKLIATGGGLLLNFYGRRFWVFPEKPSGKWQPQNVA